MDNEQRWEKLHQLMEYKSKGLQKRVIEARNEVNGLTQQKNMIVESNRQHHLKYGQKINPMSFWNQNLYSSLLSEVSHLIDERLSDHHSQLKRLESELHQQTVKAEGVNWLLQKEIQFKKENEKRYLEAEIDQHLQTAVID